MATKGTKNIKGTQGGKKRSVPAAPATLASGTPGREICLAATDPAAGGCLQVERDGGDFGGGVIRNACILSAGMAYPVDGEPFEIDAIMLTQCVQALAAMAGGANSRVGHVEMEASFTQGYSDGIHVLAGAARGARIVGTQVRGDVHLYPNCPDRELLLDIAEKNPTAIGLSIRYLRGDYVVRENAASLGRLLAVTSVDFVEKPGGNPSGLLSGNSGAAIGRPTDKTIGLGDGSPAPHAGESPGDSNMKPNPKQLKFLHQIGLAAAADDKAVGSFVAALTADQRETYEALAATVVPPAPAGNAPPSGAPLHLAGTNPPAPAVSDSDRHRIVTEALAADRSRRDAIMALAGSDPTKAPVSREWLVERAEAGCSLAQVQELVLLASAMRPLAVGAGASGVSLGEDRPRAALRAAVADGLCLRAGIALYQFDRQGRAVRDSAGRLQTRPAHELAGRYEGLPMARLAQAVLRGNGVGDVDNLSDGELVHLAMNRQAFADRYGAAASLAMGTSDLPYLLGDALRVVIRTSYSEAEQEAIYPRWTSRQPLPDFRTTDLVSVSEVPDLILHPEGGDLHYATMRDGREQIRVYVFSRGMKWTEQAQRNDQFGTFARQIAAFPQAAIRLLDRGTTAILTANAAMSDGENLFSTAHANGVLTSGSAPSVTSVGAAFASVRMQKGMRTIEDGDNGPNILNLRPAWMMTGVGLEVATTRLMTSPVDPVSTTQVPNPVQKPAGFVIGNPYLTDASFTADWFVGCDPNGPGGGVVVGYLQGEEVPQIEVEYEFGTRALKVACSHRAGFKANDFRGLYWNCGD